MTSVLSEFISHYQARIEAHLDHLTLRLNSHDTKLVEAMRYSLLGGGKRIRPLLSYASAKAVGQVNSASDDFAAALEFVHAYSLIHDDLPAMDDDALRRGKATCHIAYDEATAILAGDALQCLAFETLSNTESASAEIIVKATQALSRASGVRGMVVGQAIDLQVVDTLPTIKALEVMHHHKTGALIQSSTALGALSAGASAEQLTALEEFSYAIGLAFQVQDDILDVTSDTKTLGKTQGSDIERNKPTYVSLLGIEGAKKKATVLIEQAIQALTIFGENGVILNKLAKYIIERDF